MNYIVYSPHYDENSGGIIALHKLAAILNELGESCKIWYWTRIHPNERRIINGKVSNQFASASHLFETIGTSPFVIEEADIGDVSNACVVYPEIIEGNPLGAKHVVRWLLNKPGAITGNIAYGIDDLMLHYAPHFLPPGLKDDPATRLYLRHFPTNIYKQTNFGPRLGSCHLIRKGKHLELNYHPKRSIQIDNLPHELVAQIFNVCEEFISYDLHSAYSLFAALCGCTSIVVPQSGVTREKWKTGSCSHEIAGIAYGREDIDRAHKSLPDLFAQIDRIEKDNLAQVENFIRLTQQRFEVGKKYITVSDQPCV